jgi:hypothetical protein
VETEKSLQALKEIQYFLIENMATFYYDIDIPAIEETEEQEEDPILQAYKSNEPKPMTEDRIERVSLNLHLLTIKKINYIRDEIDINLLLDIYKTVMRNSFSVEDDTSLITSRFINKMKSSYENSQKYFTTEQKFVKKWLNDSIVECQEHNQTADMLLSVDIDSLLNNIVTAS